MAELLLVPEVAAGATEVVISEWLVHHGDTFATGDLIVVIETEKAMVEVEAETDATLLKPLVSAGTQVAVGAPLALLGSAEEVGSDLDALLAGLGAVSASQQSTASAPRDVPDPEAESPAPGQDPAPQALDTQTVQTASASSRDESDTAGDRRFVSPLARRLLREAGLAADAMTGSGPNRRVVRRDVEAAIAMTLPTGRGARTLPAGESSTWREVPHSRRRRAVASRLTKSKQEIPHFYIKRTVVIDELIAFRGLVNAESKVKISVNDLILRAVAVAHQEVPDANVTWTDEAMRVYDGVDIGVAIASDRGLVTPVVRGVDRCSISAVSTAVKSYAEQAKRGRLQQKDLEGGSITVTNLGMLGVDEFAAIINPPQSAILAVGAGTPAARVVDGRVAAVTAMTLVLSVDHRAIDGALAARWMAALIGAIDHPLRLVV